MSITKENILETNSRQAEFYNSNSASKKNLPSKVWSFFRNHVLSDFRNNYRIKERVYRQHKSWLGNLSDKKVLDLGCLRGNHLSIYMATNSKQYIGIDLSSKGIDSLNEKIKEFNAINAVGLAVDFYSEDFEERDFDIIYAYGVLHHFPDMEQLISRLKEVLKPGGIIISYDPLETSLPIRFIRTMYRPFQSDKDWEWPFSKQTINEIYESFVVLEANGILGKSKYGLFLKYFGFSKSKREKLINKWIEDDWTIKKAQDSFSCMQLSMVLKNE
ncbi:MAG: class I SAM-dependent methyltransferase [Flavobacteriaceae bacterium]